MYRHRTKGSQKYNLKMQRWRDRKEEIRLEGPVPVYPYEPPEIRRRVVIEDYDYDRITRHEFILLKSNRIDCYRVAVDGKLLPGRIGWARVLELIRKAFIRATTRVFE
jgi:hypothetical protein